MLDPTQRWQILSIASTMSLPLHSATGTNIGPAKIGRAIMGQFNVINALVLRETRTRFGRHQLGYAWALVEPALMILTFYILFSVGNRTAPPGMDILGFLSTGIVPYLAFTKCTTQVSQAINGNRGLLFYPQVKPLDVVFARVSLEFATYFAVFVLLMSINVLTRQELTIADPLLIVVGFVLACLFGASLGLIFMGLGQLSPVADRARGPLMRPFFWVSGIFFTADSLPEKYLDSALYNPVLHIVELVRAGWYPTYSDTHASITYVALWIIGLALVGLTLEVITRRKIEVT